MNNKELLYCRMVSQGIAGGRFRDIGSVVGGMGCIQAQDFGQAKWAVGLRCGAGDGAESDAGVEQAFNEGRILRTHVLRPTWHFVLPEDIGWMLQLTGPRVKNFCKPYHRKSGIDAVMLRRSKKIMVRAMEGGASLTRVEIAELLREGKIDTGNLRMNFILIDAELDGLICSGPRMGKQISYGLLEERAPRQLKLDGDAALAELVLRYFRSRGPATVADLAWWGGMNLGEARRGLAMVDQELERELVDGAEFWWGGGKFAGAAGTALPDVVLLPAFDEYAVAYGDRGRLVAAEHLKESSHGLKPVVLVRGKVEGIWKRKIEKGKATVEIKAFGKWTKAVANRVKREARRYGAFAGDDRAAVEVIG